MGDFKSFKFWSKFHFWELFYGVLTNAFFLIFPLRPTMMASIFTQTRLTI